jgi:acyl dehydratase
VIPLAWPGSRPFASRRVLVEARRVMNFAAALRDADPRYYDDTSPAALIAPPTFPASLTWANTRTLPAAMAANGWPAAAFDRQLHLRESIRLHRPVRVGDELLIRSRILAMCPARRGSSLTVRHDAVDERRAPAFTEWHTVFLPGFTCEPRTARAAGDAEPEPSTAESRPTAWKAAIAIEPLACHLYDAGANIDFPLHTSIAYARNLGWPAPLLHGTATLGFAIQKVIARELAGDPSRVHEISARFLKPVYPGTTLQLRAQARGRSRRLQFLVADRKETVLVAGLRLRR